MKNFFNYNLDKIKQEIIKNCDFPETKIYRGVTHTDENIIIIKEKERKRTSAYSMYNFYTLLMDNLPSWKEYPKRSESIICTTNITKAIRYGTNKGGKDYLVLPKKDSKIGVCSDSDIFIGFPNIEDKYGFNINEFQEQIYEILLNKMSSEDEDELVKEIGDDIKNISWETFVVYMNKAYKHVKKIEDENFFDIMDIDMSPTKNKFKLLNSNDFGFEVGETRHLGGNEVWLSDEVYLIEVEYAKTLFPDYIK